MMLLRDADRISRDILDLLSPHCDRCEIAGSIRRRCPEPRDIEIVCVRKTSGASLAAFVETVNRWPAVKGKPTGKYTQRLVGGVKLDLFMCERENWGLIFAIRTGSADFCKRTLAPAWVRAGYRSEDGMLTEPTNIRPGSRRQIPVYEESELFRLLGMPVIPPEKRT
jgi:DNA polymerase/3'-5' exonuclease PolX